MVNLLNVSPVLLQLYTHNEQFVQCILNLGMSDNDG